MSTVISISTRRRYGVARIRRVWGVARAGWAAAEAPPAPRRRPGPHGPMGQRARVSASRAAKVWLDPAAVSDTPRTNECAQNSMSTKVCRRIERSRFNSPARILERAPCWPLSLPDRASCSGHAPQARHIHHRNSWHFARRPTGLRPAGPPVQTARVRPPTWRNTCAPAQRPHDRSRRAGGDRAGAAKHGVRSRRSAPETPGTSSRREGNARSRAPKSRRDTIANVPVRN